MHIFNRVTQQTPESIELELTLASISSRGLLLIDYHVVAAILLLFLSIWLAISNVIVDAWTRVFGTDNIEIWFLAIAILAVFAINTDYFVFFEIW